MRRHARGLTVLNHRDALATLGLRASYPLFAIEVSSGSCCGIATGRSLNGAAAADVRRLTATPGGETLAALDSAEALDPGATKLVPNGSPVPTCALLRIGLALGCASDEEACSAELHSPWPFRGGSPAPAQNRSLRSREPSPCSRTVRRRVPARPVAVDDGGRHRLVAHSDINLKRAGWCG